MSHVKAGPAPPDRNTIEVEIARLRDAPVETKLVVNA